MNYVVETQGVIKRYGPNTVLNGIQLQIPQGSIFALLGPNGAGKTTTIKVLLNLIKAEQGTATILGIDSKKLGPAEFEKIGYVSEDQDILEWMTTAQFMNYCRSLYSTWDEEFAQSLMRKFDLPLNKKIGDLSRGMKRKAALISAVAFRPQLLVLDEPFTALDPLIREEFINAILETTEGENWTILISTHDIEEVEKLADGVGIINEGKIVVMESLESLYARFRRVEAFGGKSLSGGMAAPENWHLWEAQDRTARFIDSQYKPDESEDSYQKIFGADAQIQAQGLSLREIFLVIAKQFHIKGL